MPQSATLREIRDAEQDERQCSRFYVWYGIRSEPAAVGPQIHHCPGWWLSWQQGHWRSQSRFASHLIESKIEISAFRLPRVSLKPNSLHSQVASTWEVDEKGSSLLLPCSPLLPQHYQTRWMLTKQLHKELSTSSGDSLKTLDRQHAIVHVSQKTPLSSGFIIRSLFKVQSCKIIYGPSSLLFAIMTIHKANTTDSCLHSKGFLQPKWKSLFFTFIDTIIDLIQQLNLDSPFLFLLTTITDDTKNRCFVFSVTLGVSEPRSPPFACVPLK